MLSTKPRLSVADVVAQGIRDGTPVAKSRGGAARWKRYLYWGGLAIAMALAVGCASAGSRGTATTGGAAAVRFVLDAAHVPAPPGDVPAELGEAWAALRQGNAAAAREILGDLRPADADGAAARTLAGYLELGRGSLATAHADFEGALEVTPGYSRALYGLGFTAEAGGDRSLALDWYRDALDADRLLDEAAVRVQVLELRESQLLLLQAEMAEAAGDIDAASATYREAIRYGPRLLRAYVQLAELYRRIGDDEESVQVLQEARDRLGDEPAVLEPLALALQRAGAHAEAYDVVQQLAESAPDDPRIEGLLLEARQLFETSSLPERYRELESVPTLLREDLAALIAIRVPRLAERVEGSDNGVIITDIDDSWAESHIRQVVDWGIMRVWQNHAFYPETEVSRQMFADVAFRVLELIGAVEGAPRPRLQDIPAEHFYYREIQVVVGRGILELDDEDNFGVLERVSGAEAVAAVLRLARWSRAR